MARRVLADFDAELLLRIANRTDITSTMRTQFINDAIKAIANEYKHPELEGLEDEVLVLDTRELTPLVATDLWWPVEVKDIDNNRFIDFTSRTKIERHEITAGIPTEYYWWKEIFYFNRMPETDLNIRIWYKIKPDDISTGESPVFDDLYDPMVAMKAAQIALSTVGDQQAAHIQMVEAANYAARQKFPTEEHERNDRRKALTVRMWR